MACTSKGRKSKKNKGNFGKIDLYLLKEKYRFTENELLEFKQRFTYLSNAQDMLDKETFRENMGLLGLDSGAFLADRIFGVLDTDNDGHIRLDEYLKYFDILIYGSQEEKYELTFRMIDLDGKGWFSFEEFKGMILSMLYTWNNLTGGHYDITRNEKLDYFLNTVFKRFDVDNNERVTLQNFKAVVTEDPQLLEIFDYFNQGIIDSVQPNTELDQKDLVIIDELETLHLKLNQLREAVAITKATEGNSLEPPKSAGMVDNITGDFHRIDTASPKSELKTPVVSTLDSRVRKTIFFEPFRDDLDRLPSLNLGPLRQHSERVADTYRTNRVFFNTDDFLRTKSLETNHQKAKTEEDQRNISNSKADPKYQSIQVIYQDDILPISNRKELGDSIFKKEQSQPIQDNQYNTSPGGSNKPNIYLSKPIDEVQSLNYETPRKDEINPDDIEFQIGRKNEKENTVKTENPHANATASFGVLKNGSLADNGLQTPKSKFDLKIYSTPMQPKVLNPDIDAPEYPEYEQEEDIPPTKIQPQNQRQTEDFRKKISLIESVIISKPAGPEPYTAGPRLSSGLNSASARKSFATNQPLQVKQLQEQLDALASETLKIIDEIRGKKKKNVTPNPPEVEEGQKRATAQNIHRMTPKPKDKKGNFVSFGHQNWNLVLNMMLGIQMAVKSVVEKSDPPTEKDFKVKFIFELVPKRTNEAKDLFKICTFFDYAPSIFFELRRLYGIKNDDYLKSIGPETMLSNLIKGNLASLSELTSSGKSGSFFYYSADGKYTLKTISRDEFHFLRQIIKNYYTHLINNPQSLMIKFFGLHKIRFMKKNRTKEKVYFIIMANVFHTFKEIHVRYDLKGSTKGRFTQDPDPTVAKKDLNILLRKEKIVLPPEIAESFGDIIDKDSLFFQENNIIDYSLLVGIHYISQDEINANQVLGNKRGMYESRIHSREGVLSADNTKIYFFGIIDILTQYNAKKKAEYVFKRMAYGKGISAVPPRQYCERFRKFIKSLIVKHNQEEGQTS